MQRTIPVTIALALVLGLFGSASASYYGGDCYEAACTPFSATNSYIQQKAVTVATSNNAAVGDTITIMGPPAGRCVEQMIQWTVNQVPTLNSTHLTHLQSWCIVGGNH